MTTTLFDAMVRYKQKLELKQLFLGRLMDIGTELFAISATCAYALSYVKANPQDPSPIELADYFCWIARRRIEESFAALTDNDDKKTRRLAEKVIKKEFRWLEKGIEWMGPDQ